MSVFDEFLSALKPALIKYAQTTWQQFQNQAIDDANDFVNKTKQDLETWTQQLAEHQITAADFKFNLKAKAASAELRALKQAGLAEAEWDRFTGGLVEVILNTAKSTFL